LFSVYHDRNRVKFWIITEADRSATTILLPEDYWRQEGRKGAGIPALILTALKRKKIPPAPPRLCRSHLRAWQFTCPWRHFRNGTFNRSALSLLAADAAYIGGDVL